MLLCILVTRTCRGFPCSLGGRILIVAWGEGEAEAPTHHTRGWSRNVRNSTVVLRVGSNFAQHAVSAFWQQLMYSLNYYYYYFISPLDYGICSNASADAGANAIVVAYERCVCVFNYTAGQAQGPEQFHSGL